MRYFYYPGCSLEGSAVEYDVSTRALMGALGAELVEIEDWTCCGASAADAASPLLSLALPARNLALAEKSGVRADLLAPCSACYLNLRKANDRMAHDLEALEKVNAVLEADGLHTENRIRVRHLLDVLAKDVGRAGVEPLVKRRLTGMRVAVYYGCQALRPFRDFDDPEMPRSMEPLIEALGAEVHEWSMGSKCCGAGLMTTKKTLALQLAGEILDAARGVDCIVTACPMCQMNLDCYQKKISGLRGRDLGVSVLYLPQLMGLALGLGEAELAMEKNMVVKPEFMAKVRAAETLTGAVPAASEAVEASSAA